MPLGRKALATLKSVHRSILRFSAETSSIDQEQPSASSLGCDQYQAWKYRESWAHLHREPVWATAFLAAVLDLFRHTNSFSQAIALYPTRSHQRSERFSKNHAKSPSLSSASFFSSFCSSSVMSATWFQTSTFT